MDQAFCQRSPPRQKLSAAKVIQLSDFSATGDMRWPSEELSVSGPGGKLQRFMPIYASWHSV